MNRKKTIDYTVTRRSRNSYSQPSSSKPRTESRDHQRGRGDGDRDKKPFWKDDKNVGSESNYSALENLHQDADLKDLQEEISRAVLSQESLLLSGQDNRDSYSREEVRGPIIDEFSEDAHDYRSSKSSRKDYRESRDQQQRKRDDNHSRKRSYSPTDDRSSASYRKSREDTPTKRSHSTTSSIRQDSGEDDLRNVLKQYQKSKWDDEDARKDRKGYNSKASNRKGDRKRNKDTLGMPSSSDIFTMSSQGTLGSLPLEPLHGSKDFYDSSFSEDYREKDWCKEDKRTYRDSSKDRDYTSSRYRSIKQDRRGSLDYGQRGNDLENMDSRYNSDGCDFRNETELERILYQNRESPDYARSNLGSDTVRDLSVTELAQMASEKFKTGFELGRPFFGFNQGQEQNKQGWQDQAAGGGTTADSIWNESSDLLLEGRNKSYGETLGKDDFLLNRDRKDYVESELSSFKTQKRDSYFKDDKNDNSGQRGILSPVLKQDKSGSLIKTPGGSSSKLSAPSTSKAGPKPLFQLGFMPRQVKVPLGKNTQKTGVNKGNHSPPLLPKKSGYFPRQTRTTSRSRSRSSERVFDNSDIGSNIGSKKPPSKGTFTSQNWLSLGGKNKKEEGKENESLKVPQLLSSTRGRGRGNILTSNRGKYGRGGFQQKPGVGRAVAGIAQRGRGRGIRGKGTANRGRGSSRGRGLVTRGRGRGLSQPPVGANVRNIFRRSKSRSPEGGRHKRPSRSSGSSRRSRSRRRGSRSRSRSSSYCSTCSSGSCSTCHSWRSISVDSLNGDHDKKRHVHHKGKSSSKHDVDRRSEKSLDKLKEDIKHMEKELEKKVKDASVTKPSGKPLDSKPSNNKSTEKKPTETRSSDKKPLEKKPLYKKPIDKKPPENSVQKSTKDAPKGKSDVKMTKSDPKVDFRHTKGEKLKDQKGNVFVKEEKAEKPFDGKREVKRKTDNSREVILKSDKHKESPLVIKKEKESPAREVKIISEKKTRGDEVLDESSSKMKGGSLKITIDQPKWLIEAKKSKNIEIDQPKWSSDTKQSKNIEIEDERTVDSRKKSSKSPPGKQKKKDKEKVKSKKAKKKSKKRKHDRDSADSGDESVYSSISGQDDFPSSNDEKSKYLQPYAERTVEFSSGAYDSNMITVHYAKRGTGRKLSEGDTSKSRANLITIPVSKEQPLYPNGSRPRKIGGAAPPHEKVFDDGSSDVLYSEVSYTGNESIVDYETAGFTGEFQGEHDYGPSYQGNGAVGQEWDPGHGEGGEYYYEEGAKGEGYEQEYYTYPQEGEVVGAGDVQGEENYQEWYEGEYVEGGTVEGETADAEYEGEYYLAEDGLYYPVEGEAYEEYQGEYVEGGGHQVVDPGQGGDIAEEGYGYQYAEEGYQYAEEGYQYVEEGHQYAEEGAEWQQYEDGTVYQTEEGWGQGEVEGQWEEYQEGYPDEQSEWGPEYTQGNEYEVVGHEYPAEGAEALPQEGYNVGDEYDQSQYYVEGYQQPEDPHSVEQSFQPQLPAGQVQVQGTSAMKDNFEYVSTAPPNVEDNKKEARPLKSILKKGNQAENKGTKLVSERLAQMKKQPTSKLDTPMLGSTSALSSQAAKKTEQNQRQDEEAKAQSESDRYREIEQEILSSQPKDAIGTEFIVRVHGTGMSSFFCKLCNCRFNTLTAKNLHVKGMKHIELYIRLKSQLLESVIKDTKGDTAKRPAEEGSFGVQKVPRLFN